MACGASLVAMSVSGCGPIGSTYLIWSAQAELDHAKELKADELAPYEYEGSVQYLAKAREEQSVSHFEPSIDFARRAREFAEQGVQRIRLKREGEANRELEVQEVLESTAPAPTGPAGSGRNDIIIQRKNETPENENETDDVPEGAQPNE